MDEELMIKVIDARLHYLFSECPSDKYNAEEVNALINLLKEYNPDAVGKSSKSHTQSVHIPELSYQDSQATIAMIAFTMLVLLTLFKPA